MTQNKLPPHIVLQESKVDIVKTYCGEFSDYKFYNKGSGIYQIKTDSGYEALEDSRY